MFKHLLVKKTLLILALHGAAAFDAVTTERVLNLHRRMPLVITNSDHGNTFTQTISGGGVYSGYETDPFLGRHPSPARVAFQVNGDALLADLLLLKHRRGGLAFAVGVVAEHTALGIHNLHVAGGQ